MNDNGWKEEIRGPSATLAVRLGIEGHSIPKLSLGQVTSGEWGGFRLHEARTTFELDETGELILEVVGIREAPTVLSVQDIPAAPLEVDVEGGRLTAQHAFLRVLGFDESGIRLVVGLHDWRWSSTSEPVAYVALIEGAQVERGNLSLVLERDGKQHHANGGLVLNGSQGRWFLIPSSVRTRWGSSNENALAVIEPPRPRARADLAVHFRRALRCLEFALGRHVCVSSIVGVDDRLVPVAALGVEYGARRRSRRRSPVIASASNPRQQWQPSVFNSLLAYVERVGSDDSTFIATATYLDSLWLHLDGGYLQGQIALEAFCKSAGERTGPIVRDPEEWLAWIADHEAEIAKHAIDSQSGAVLLKKVASAQHGTSGDVVMGFFETRGVELPKALRHEIKKRGRVAHVFLMSEQETRDVQEDLRRLSIVQMLLAAAVTLHIGWDGPIAGDRTGESVPEWWPHQQRETPLPYFFVAYSDAPRIAAP